MVVNAVRSDRYSVSVMSVPDPSDSTSWVVNPYQWRESQTLADELGVPLVVGMVLAGRGIADSTEARRFLDCAAPLPDPFLFGGMAGAVSTISEAIDRGGRIVVHGDYDADGITATVLMVLGLRALGLEAEWYLPNRFEEGYGLSRKAVETIAGGGPAVLITVDCGVNYPDEVGLARELGLEVVVVDHHRPGPVLPECHLIHEVAGEYPHGDLCGVGLALKLMHALHVYRCGAERDALPEPLEALLDLVAIGTIADLASLQGENRYYVKEGLKLIGIGQRVGLRALASVAGCTGAVDSGTVAYRLAPRLNAAGRLADPSPPLRLLLTEDESEAKVLAAKLQELNGARQDVERQILDEAVTRVEALSELPPVIVLAAQEWHEGVVGIVASRLVERYHRPTILLGVRDGLAKGSGRSIPAYDLMDGLNACAGLLSVFGGHTQAAGLTLEVDRVDAFRQALEQHAGLALTSDDLVPTYRADAVLRGEDLNADTAVALAALGPFGSGNPRPRLLMVDAAIHEAEPTRTGAHLRCVVQVDGVRTRGIGFGMGGAAAALREAGRGHLVGGQLRVDEWQGALRPELLLERIGLSQDPVELSDPAACSSVGNEQVAWVENGSGTVPPLSGAGLLCLPPARDMRDRPGRASSIAQVLATRERLLMLCCSLPHTLSDLGQRVPIRALAGAEAECVGRGCSSTESMGLTTAPLILAEWDAAARAPGFAGARAHVLAVDPPFRAEHVALLREAAAQGAIVHLCYGEEERQATLRLLRRVVHPRFAMVCLYRAMQNGAQTRDATYSQASAIAWQQARVALTFGDLARAEGILLELGVQRAQPGEAKLEAGGVPAYVSAEADYEECKGLCLTL